MTNVRIEDLDEPTLINVTLVIRPPNCAPTHSCWTSEEAQGLRLPVAAKYPKELAIGLTCRRIFGPPQVRKSNGNCGPQLRALPALLQTGGSLGNCRSLRLCWSGRSSPKRRHSLFARPEISGAGQDSLWRGCIFAPSSFTCCAAWKAEYAARTRQPVNRWPRR